MKIIHTALFGLLVVFATGCKKSPEVPSLKTSRLKEFLSHTDQLLKIQRLPEDSFQLPEEHKDTQTGTIKSHWVPARVSILPVTIEEVQKENSRIRGANITVEDDYYVVSGYGSPTEGKHSKGTAALDVDELVDLQSAIGYVQETARQWRAKNPSDDTIMRFKSKDGLSLELEQDDATRKVVFGLAIDGTNAVLGDEQLAALSGKIGHAIDELKKR